MEQNNMLAMILAGGRGTRLYELTKKTAKPAVYFGGKYRIIDFPISNCANSNINVVGVLTQYEPVELNAYAGAGQRWGLDTRGSGVYVLPPSEKDGTKFDVYRGTADAITQNIEFIDTFDPDYVLVLSGDHIYKMDYDKMLADHKANSADATIAVLPVSWKEASRFGIMNVDDESRIIEFEEKPAEPKSNLASMGIYIFNWKLLRKELIEDAKREGSSHDFGHDIIPSMLNQDKRLYAYRFEGYWKDVGTIDSLWEANMDLLNKNNELDLDDPNWKIYTADIPTMPHYVGPNGKVEHCYINQGAIIRGNAKDSVLFNNVTIEEGADVRESVLMPGVHVGAGAKVYRAIVAEGVKVDPEATVGSLDSKEIALVAKRVRKGE
ncbi:glucose-1-phosphate adenylyltransferase [Dubosiella muris]|uniref:Glucose-1-phosphate adenylyltransferase n=5 Tax=Dubosiella TaxID=1937008 RepID=A0AC61R4T2_9FIRM|nr:glucose-1-phosphate adenylyltransferase [Dubosiella muris]TGY64991.1 glucose-1-phosphate adenylyltransferase [Dubosiella muris]